MALYHYTLGIPAKKYPSGVFKLTYTKHAIDATKTDKYGPIKNLPKYLNTFLARKIEVETDNNGNLVKILYRMPYDDERDLSIAVIVRDDEDKWKVKTVWTQQKNDNHKTLDKTRYHQ